MTWGRPAPFWSLFLLPNQRLRAPALSRAAREGAPALRGCPGWWAGAEPVHRKPQPGRPQGGVAGASGPVIRGAPGAGGASLAAEPLDSAEAGPVANPRPEAGLTGRA